MHGLIVQEQTTQFAIASKPNLASGGSFGQRPISCGSCIDKSELLWEELVLT
ncbi:MAG: hypothetical protein KDA29_01015 [Phycisphaerales bacterium]|nr:hypothetical protein [Phycisphaerales bacterium]